MLQSIDIPIPSGVRLAGVLHLPDAKPRAAAVICHGMLSYKDSPKHQAIAEGLCQHGIAALRFDFEGRGESPGDLLMLSFSRQVIEARAAVAQLRRLTGAQRIGLTGSSMGGAVAILLAADPACEIAGLVSMAAVARTDQLTERIAGPKGVALWQRKGYLRLQQEPVGWSLVEDGRRIDVPGAAAKVACPWLILHGERDEVVPVSDAELLQRATHARAELQVLAGADHQFSDPVHLKLMVDRAVAFLARALAGRDRP